MILQVALGHLQVAAVLVVELIGEGVLHPAPVLVTARRPLVPARDEENLGIQLQGVVELLREAVAHESGLASLLDETILEGRGEGAADDVLALVHGGASVGDVAVVDGHADGGLLHGLALEALGVLVVGDLRVGSQPAPVADLSALDLVSRLTRAPGKEVFDLLVEVGACADVSVVSHEHGLFVPVEPKVLELTRAEDIQVEHLDLLAAAVGGAEGQEEGHLGNIHRAVGLGVVPGLHERGVAGLPGIRAVGVIGEDGIHPRVGQQLGVAAEHPGIVGTVVAVEGLVPEVGGSASLGPGLMIVIADGFGVLQNEIVDVEGLGEGQIHVPRPVEHGNGLVLLDPAHILKGEGLTAETIGEDPGVGHDLVGVDQVVGGHLPLGRRCMLAVDGILGALDLAEGLHRGLGKGNRNLPGGRLLHAALIGVGVAHGGGHLPRAQAAARELVDADEVLPRGLLVEGEHGVTVVGVLLDLLGGHGSLFAGGVEVGIPLVEGQGQVDGLVPPGGHTEGELIEGRAKAHADADGGALGELAGRVGRQLGGIKGLDGHGLVRGDVLLGVDSGHKGGEGAHGHNEGKDRGEEAVRFLHNRLLWGGTSLLLYRILVSLSTDTGDFFKDLIRMYKLQFSQKTF